MTRLTRNEDRRVLADFVRHCRSQLEPEAVGLPRGTRRRTPGLRREEVAQLAGIGITWYTWFEQGRDIQVSTDFLERLARALRLQPAERSHLFTLAQQRPPPYPKTGDVQVTTAVCSMLASLPNPAYIKTSRWDITVWNTAATVLFGDFGNLAPAERNVLRLVFLNPRFQKMMLDWESDARRVLSKFRLDYGRANGAPGFETLVNELCEGSVEFRQWWGCQDVSGYSEGLKRFRNDASGLAIAFEHTSYIVEGAPDLRLVVYTPATEADRSAFLPLCADVR